MMMLLGHVLGKDGRQHLVHRGLLFELSRLFLPHLQPGAHDLFGYLFLLLLLGLRLDGFTGAIEVSQVPP
jgi:hypothetical protein